MRIAVPVWEDKISPVLDTASRLLVIDTQDERETGRFETLLEEPALSRRCGRIKALAVDVLICGAVSRQFLHMLKASDVRVIAGIAGPLEEVLDAYWQKQLRGSKFLMPGCKENRNL